MILLGFHFSLFWFSLISHKIIITNRWGNGCDHPFYKIIFKTHYTNGSFWMITCISEVKVDSPSPLMSPQMSFGSVVNHTVHFVFLLCCHQSLSDPNNYHEFCRLLARLKSNYQLGELVKVENYPEVIRLIANFTVTSLQVCLWLLGSFFLNIGNMGTCSLVHCF